MARPFTLPPTAIEGVTAWHRADIDRRIAGDYNAQGFKDSSGNLLQDGEIRWTAYTTDDESAPGVNTCKLEPFGVTCATRRLTRWWARGNAIER